MKIKYYIVTDMGASKRKIAQDATQRNCLTQLTGHRTITKDDKQALEGLGFELVEVKL